MSTGPSTQPSLQMLRECLGGYAGRPREEALAMPPGFYTSAEFLGLERENLFRREWFCLGRVEEIPLPGDFFATDLVGEPLLVVRGSDGLVRVLSNVCRHRGTPVASGCGSTHRFVCPYHAWTYDTEGRLLKSPYMEARTDFDIAAHCLPAFRSETWNGFIYVNLDVDAPPLAPQLEGLEPLVGNYHMQDMRVRYCEEEVWETNWKCVVENFMEGYHLSHVHYSTLHPITPTRLCEHFAPGPGYLGYHANFPPEHPVRGRHHPDLEPHQLQRSVMFCVLPSHGVGAAAHLTTYVCVQPLSECEARVKLGVSFFDAEITDPDLEAAIDLFERTMAEDRVQLARLQQGLRSRHLEPGPLAPADYEGTVWDFYQYLAPRLGALRT